MTKFYVGRGSLSIYAPPPPNVARPPSYGPFESWETAELFAAVARGVRAIEEERKTDATVEADNRLESLEAALTRWES